MKNYKNNSFLVLEDASIEESLVKIEENKLGLICAINENGHVVGIATDGDIRRAILTGLSIKDHISSCMNTDFVHATPDTSRENLIKLLDNKIHFIPLLDENGMLVSIVTSDHLPLRQEEPIYVRARAPVRVSFGGGGSDLTHYFVEYTGAVINAAVSIYSHATMKVRSDRKISISSLDLNKEFTANNLNEALDDNGEFGLIKSILKVVSPTFGFDLYLHSDFPMGSGLGGSATLSAAVLGCFNVLRHDQWDNHELAEIAFEAERLHLGIAGGWQDQYAAVFGGFNFIEFGMDQNIIHPIKVPNETILELEECLVLCDTGISHDSGNIHLDQKKTMESKSVKELVKANVGLTYKVRNLLLRGNLQEFGKCLDTAWHLKRKFSNLISNKYIDSIYAGALKNGALGGKLLGAGGGGFFVFYVPPFKKHRLLQYLTEKKLRVQPFRFEVDGLKAWALRENKSSLLFKKDNG